MWSGEDPYYYGWLNGFDFSGFAFDSSLSIYLCSDLGGTTNLGACDFQNAKFVYKYSNSLSDFAYFGSSINPYSTMLDFILATLIGNYQFTEATGYSTASSAGSLGTAYFGASTSSTSDTTYSPLWLTTVILSKPSPTYIMLPRDGESPSPVQVNTSHYLPLHRPHKFIIMASQ